MQRNTQKVPSPTRILALDLHPRSFGYVVMERAGQLLDWGVKRSYANTKEHPEVLLRRRLRTLLQFWNPGVVVAGIDIQSKRTQPMYRKIRSEVSGAVFLSLKKDRRQDSKPGKHERAVTLATRFPEISWKLPPKRKPWESEQYSMSIFAAAEVALTYLGRPEARTSSSEGLPHAKDD